MIALAMTEARLTERAKIEAARLVRENTQLSCERSELYDRVNELEAALRSMVEIAGALSFKVAMLNQNESETWEREQVLAFDWRCRECKAPVPDYPNRHIHKPDCSIGHLISVYHDANPKIEIAKAILEDREPAEWAREASL